MNKLGYDTSCGDNEGRCSGHTVHGKLQYRDHRILDVRSALPMPQFRHTQKTYVDEPGAPLTELNSYVSAKLPVLREFNMDRYDGEGNLKLKPVNPTTFAADGGTPAPAAEVPAGGGEDNPIPDRGWFTKRENFRILVESEISQMMNKLTEEGKTAFLTEEIKFFIHTSGNMFGGAPWEFMERSSGVKGPLW